MSRESAWKIPLSLLLYSFGEGDESHEQETAVQGADFIQIEHKIETGKPGIVYNIPTTRFSLILLNLFVHLDRRNVSGCWLEVLFSFKA